MRSDLLKRLEELPTSPVVRFLWQRKRGGYEIAKGWEVPKSEVDLGKDVDHRPAIFIAETPTARSQKSEWYDPASEHPALFQELAGLEVSTDALLLTSLLRFVNDWGLPTYAGTFIRGNPQEPKLSSGELTKRAEPGWPVNGVSLYPLLRVNHAVRMYETLKSASSARLRHSFGRPFNDSWAYIDEGPQGGLRLYLDPKLQDLADCGDFRTVLARMLQDLANQMLSNACSPVLLWEPNALSFQIKMVPHHLVGFTWVQFADAVVGGKDFWQCASCARWMEIGPGQGRREKTYCSDACRMRAYRKRKAHRAQKKGAGRQRLGNPL
jgi:hypothetical protein